MGASEMDIEAVSTEDLRALAQQGEYMNRIVRAKLRTTEDASAKLLAIGDITIDKGDKDDAEGSAGAGGKKSDVADLDANGQAKAKRPLAGSLHVHDEDVAPKRARYESESMYCDRCGTTVACGLGIVNCVL